MEKTGQDGAEGGPTGVKYCLRRARQLYDISEGHGRIPAKPYAFSRLSRPLCLFVQGVRFLTGTRSSYGQRPFGRSESRFRQASRVFDRLLKSLVNLVRDEFMVKSVEGNFV